MNTFKEHYNNLCNTPSDINEHLPTLYSYATRCETIFETGVRTVVSSWALAYGLLNNTSTKKYLFLNDIQECNITYLLNAAQNTELTIDHAWKNNLDLQLSHRFDMLFIDTWHVYGQLKRELEKFANKINKFIILHDTTTFSTASEASYSPQFFIEQTGWPAAEVTTGLWPAIEEFLEKNSNDWTLHTRYFNCNGLTILKRVNE